MNTKIIKLDINKKMFEVITAKQGDTKSRFILFNLYDGPIQFNLTDRMVRVYGKKKDNTIIFNDLVITDAKKGYCILELTNQMLAVNGMYELELVIFEGEKRLSTMPFILNVIGSKYSEDAIVSTNEFTALMNALETVQAIENKAEKKDVENLSSQLENIENISYNKIPISRFNINENDDITDIINNLEDNKILVLDGDYKITDTVVLKNKHLTGGCIYYEGSIDKQAFIIRQNGGLYDTKIKINVENFTSDLILIDYTDSDIQLDRNDYILRDLKIDNAIQSTYVENSCCIKINANKYQVISYQNIDNIKFTGVMDYGIYIELILRNNVDNPVYNTTMFSNINFESVNCALKVLPKMISGEVENSKGGVGLYLNKFSNQHKSWINKPFIDVVNTTLEGNLVIPWDYFGDNIPVEGTYKTLNSTILLSRNYFDDTKVLNKDVFYNYCLRSTGEIFSNMNVTRAKDINNEAPIRSSGIGWGIDNIKQVVFTPQTEYNPYNHRYMGFEFQQNNGDNPQNNTYQLGINRNGKIILRHYNSTTNQWEKPVNIMVEGKISQSYSGNRPDGFGVGDMKFDTGIKKPVFWDGTQWILADGTKAF